MKCPARDRLPRQRRQCYFHPMTATDLKNYWHASPFVPFNIVLSSGERVAVPHPDFLTVSPTGTIAHVWRKDGNYVFIDVLLITAVETARHGVRSRRRSTGA